MLPSAGARGGGREMATAARRPTVFVVDDDDSVRKGLERVLRAEGFSVVLFDSAERFLEHVSPESSACVLLDLTMPRVGGLEVQRQLNARGIALPVIAVSASDDDT